MNRSASVVEIEPGRYARHRLVDWFDQDEVASVRALVVGAGAIGNEVLKNLALLGVCNLSIADLDRIEIHNLTRSVLFRESDVGRSKAAVAAERVKELLPEANTLVMDGALEATLRPSTLAMYDVVFSCLDNFEARLALDEMCQLAGVNMVSGAIDARYSSVELYPYRQSRRCGCYSCNLPAGVFQRIAQRYSCGWLRRVGLVERKVPTTIITSSMVASMMVSWGLRLGTVDGTAEPTSKRLLTDTFSGLATESELLRSENCPSCNRLERQIQTLPWSGLLRLLPDGEATNLLAHMATEVVFSAQCAECAFDASNSIPKGSRLREHSTDARTCAACGANAVAIDARDRATLGELASLAGGKAPNIPYVLVDIGATTFCLEIENE
jgi:molybdopterin/thiamine biosynthesis adenylyltransferase